MKKQILALAISTICITSSQAQAFSTRIIGGQTAQPSAYPWVVSLRDSQNQQFCGASLVAANWVMTAAHCVEGGSNDNISAVVGDFDLQASDQGEQRQKIERVVIYPKRSADNNDYDIALLKLSKPVGNSAVVAATGSLMEGLSNGTPFTAMGWGNRSTTGEDFPNQLHQVRVPLIERGQCNEYYEGDITENMICAGLAQGGKDSCQGDSGGPLVYQKDGQWHQVGIVSWGEGCAQPRSPGVYARVASFSDWITEVTTGNGSGTEGGDNDNDPGSDGNNDGDTDSEGPDTEVDQDFGLPEWLDFYAYDAQAVEEMLEFVNTTDATVSIPDISIDQAAFSLVENGCSGTIPSGESCDLQLQYTPSDIVDEDMAIMQLSVSNGALIDVELYGENLTAVEEGDDSDGDLWDWFSSDADWQAEEEKNAFVLNCWDIQEGETSHLETEFQGPGILEFNFSLPEESAANRLVYLVDDKVVRTLKGGEKSNGKHRTELSDGKHRIRWIYQKKSASTGQAKVGNVTFLPRASESGQANVGATDPAATSANGGGAGAGGPLMLLSLLGMGLLRRLKRSH